MFLMHSPLSAGECLVTCPADVLSIERANTREPTAELSDSRSETHPELGPAAATRCHSLLLAGTAILGVDLHEWLFLLVTA
jgi:hypothetical protein